jgi:hypothetical protein
VKRWQSSVRQLYSYQRCQCLVMPRVWHVTSPEHERITFRKSCVARWISAQWRSVVGYLSMLYGAEKPVVMSQEEMLVFGTAVAVACLFWVLASVFKERLALR